MTVERVRLPPRSETLTSAPTIAAPLLSSTVPLIDPVSWAGVVSAKQSMASRLSRDEATALRADLARQTDQNG